jgi:hypothetical protein
VQPISAADRILVGTAGHRLQGFLGPPLTAWLANRRPGVCLKVTRGDVSVEIDVTAARHLQEVVALYRLVSPKGPRCPDSRRQRRPAPLG